MRKHGCALLVALLAAGAAVGCGDEEEALSKAEYIKQGDAICKKSGDELNKEAEEFFAELGSEEEPSDEQVTTFVEDTLKPGVEGVLSDLRDLPVPEGDEDELDDIYEEFETGLAKVEADPELSIRTDSDPFEAASEAAGAYGFKECGES